jgi:endoglucanase
LTLYSVCFLSVISSLAATTVLFGGRATTNETSAHLLIEPAAVKLAGSSEPHATHAILRGANISGGDFGTAPGTYGIDYTYPTKAEIDYYAARGFDVLRVPFLWQRVQHELYGDLDSVGDGTGDFERLSQVMQWITDRGMIAVLDLHDYGGRSVNGRTVKVGSETLPTSALEDLWVRLAKAFNATDLVWYGLMNEPTGISAADWKTIAQSVTNAIRATGANNRILVPGTAYSGAHSWVSSGNAEQMATFSDPENNFAFDVHQYLDADSSGKQGICIEGAGASRLTPFIDWAKRAPGRRGFLGEFAASDPSVAGQEQCRAELAALLEAAETSGVFIGWTAWGGGGWWDPSYIFRLEPTDLSGPDTNYMKMLLPHLPR